MACIGICLGISVASGTLALLIALGIVVRYMRITKTGDKVSVYEDSALLGTFFGGIWGIFQWKLSAGSFGLIIYGFFSGFFLGSWIVALEEVVNVYAILFRRIRLKKGIGLVFLAMALGKILGTLLFFWKGWW